MRHLCDTHTQKPLKLAFWRPCLWPRSGPQGAPRASGLGRPPNLGRGYQRQGTDARGGERPGRAARGRAGSIEEEGAGILGGDLLPSSSSPTRKAGATITFRNYAPSAPKLKRGHKDVDDPPSVTAGGKVDAALSQATEPRDPEEPLVVRQKKIDWDLKRDIQPQMDILERRTRIATRELLRRQLAQEVRTGLAVNATTRLSTRVIVARC